MRSGLRVSKVLSAIILGSTFFSVSLPVVSAQQTVFNVPSADVMDRGKLYGELDMTYNASTTSGTFTPRVVVGIGRRVEVGMNLNGMSTPGVVQMVPTPTFKWKPFESVDRLFSVIIGDDVFIPAVHRSYSTGNYLYAEAAKTLGAKTRVTAGVYDFTSHVVTSGNHAGGQFAIEQPVGTRLTVAGDWYTGAHALGYFSPGIVFKATRKLTWYACYQIGNSGSSRGNHQFLIEIGWNLD